MHDIYFYQRAETELKMAQSATDPAAVKAHYELANMYLDRFYNHAGDGAQPKTWMVDGSGG